MFTLHPDLERSSAFLADLLFCQARLHLDARFPWIVLVPRLADADGIENVDQADHTALMAEIRVAGVAVRAMGEAAGRPVARLNVGVLGNITPQLHIHVVGRRPGDAAWPGPVWGLAGAETYSTSGLARARHAALAALRL